MPEVYAGQKYGTTPYGGPLQDQISAKPLLAKLYTFGGVFIKSLGPILNRPKFKWTLNAGGHPIEIDLPAQDTTATAPVPGNLLVLQEDGGDGSVVYKGIIEDVPDDLDVTIRHALVVQPMVTELGNAAFNAYYSTLTDVAAMVRAAVAATSHLTWDVVSVPLTGQLAIYNFVHTTALDVLTVGRLMAGVNYFWFVDETGKVWFQAFSSSRAIYTLKRGQEYRVRKVSSPIANQINHLVVVGAVPPQASAPITSIYDGASQASIGVRAAKTPYVYKTVSDQGTLDAIKTTMGNAFDRQLTKVQFTVDNLPGRIQLGQKSGATVRYWEPAANEIGESEVGTGTFSPNYVVLDVEDDGIEKVVIAGDIPINGVNDLKYDIDRIIQRTALDALTYTPAAFTTQVNTIIGGGVQTAVDPIGGAPSAARWKLDATAFRAFDGTATDYGLPDGQGETVRLGSDGVAWLSKLLLQSAISGARIVLDTKTDPANPIIKIYDSTPTSRAEMGSLPANGISGAQFGFRANDASGAPIFDSIGLMAVQKQILASTGTGQTLAGVAGVYPQWQSLRSSTFTIPTGRTLSVLIIGMVTGQEIQTVVGPVVIQPNLRMRIVGQSTVLAAVPWSANGSQIGTATPLAVVASLAAGTYTADLFWASMSGTNDSITTYDERLYVFQLGG